MGDDEHWDAIARRESETWPRCGVFVSPRLGVCGDRAESVDGKTCATHEGFVPCVAVTQKKKPCPLWCDPRREWELEQRLCHVHAVRPGGWSPTFRKKARMAVEAAVQRAGLSR
jgi:hypothetical protein